tara:strand:+ start:146 stop:922 length:777 start_codon:yes stop_codon:yes gene_type:complete
MNILENVIERNIKDSIIGYLKKRQKITTFHPLDLIFPIERKIRSKVGGLEGSLGSFWERLAKDIAKINNFEVLDENVFNQSVPAIPENIQNKITEFRNRRIQGDMTASTDFFKELHNFIKQSNIVSKSIPIQGGQGADIYLRKDNKEYLIDIKTAQPNKKSTTSFFDTALLWYASYALKNTGFDFECFIAFPYNPYKKDFWIANKSKIPPLIPSYDAKVADEFWDFLSGKKNTTKLILEIFKDIGDSDFPEQFKDYFY